MRQHVLHDGVFRPPRRSVLCLPVSHSEEIVFEALDRERLDFGSPVISAGPYTNELSRVLEESRGRVGLGQDDPRVVGQADEITVACLDDILGGR